MRGIKTAVLCGGLAVLCLTATGARATTLTYTDRTTFESTLGVSITDDYSAAGYQVGDVNTEAGLAIHTNAHMSAILGETEYQSTGFEDWNLVVGLDTNPFYCAGCNGSFILGFTATSLGDGNGVFGVGFNFYNASSDTPYHAFVTFGDLSTLDVLLPVGTVDPLGFFAITSEIGIRSIALGLANGGTTQGGSFRLDNLTIGAAAETNDVPEPGTLALFGAGLAVLGLARRRRGAA